MNDPISIAERQWREGSIEIPENYDRAGVAILPGAGARLYITGPHVPAMYWDGSQWVSIVFNVVQA